MPAKPVLIVEDEIFLAMDIERILADAGYPVVGIAADRAEAMAVADGAQIAFVDVNLRDGPTGPDLACDLARRGVTIVYVTANPSQIKPRAEGAIGVVRKPFRDEAILMAAAFANDGLPGLRPPTEDITLFAGQAA